MPTVLVTSANRGIGREFVRQYAQAGWRVIAACRSPELEAEALRAMGDVRPIGMDVTDLVSVEAAARESADPLHLLINSAGVIGQTGDGPGEVDYREWARVLDVNLMGPVRVLDSFAERLAASGSSKAVAITSGMGSLADVQSPMAMMYRTSKAGLNMAMRVRALQLRPRGVTVAVINPGWVRTDMGGPGAKTSVEDSVAGMRAAIESLSADRAGSFLNWQGGDLPW
jgi:NAD(P)-dependent dehydrogenase (short-subunit alcohol dehydrogenase family)